MRLWPVRQCVVVHSPFTGVTRLLPHVGGIKVINGVPSALSVQSPSRMALSIVDAQGNMTKAVGTLRWMAPEMFRGDQNYTNAVDVYSFGMVLWELATREVPWSSELRSNELQFFVDLSLALQQGRRPRIPDTVIAEHNVFVALMQRCWAGDPVDRPTFSEAANDLAACLRTQA